MVICKKQDCKYRGFSAMDFPCKPCPDNPSFSISLIPSNYSPDYLTIDKMNKEAQEVK